MNPIIVVFGSEKFVAGLLLALGLYWIAQYPMYFGWQIFDIRKLWNKKKLLGSATPMWALPLRKFGIRITPRTLRKNFYVAWTDMLMSAFMVYKSFDKPSLAVMLTVANVVISVLARLYTDDDEGKTPTGKTIHVPSFFRQWGKDFRDAFVEEWNKNWGPK